MVSPDDGYAQRKRFRRQSTQDSSYPTPREERQARARILQLEETRKELAKVGATTVIKTNGSSSKPSEVGYEAETGALTLTINASDDCNTVDGFPTAMDVVVYHLRDCTAFNHLTATEDGLITLLDGRFFDAQSVRSVKRLTVQPGDTLNLSLDRADRGRYVAVVAGYNQPSQATSVFLTEYPIGQYVQTVRNTLFSSKVLMFYVQSLSLGISLDSQAMVVRRMPPPASPFIHANELGFAEAQYYLGID